MTDDQLNLAHGAKKRKALKAKTKKTDMLTRTSASESLH